MERQRQPRIADRAIDNKNVAASNYKNDFSNKTSNTTLERYP